MIFPSTKFKDDSSQSTGLAFIRVYNNWHTQIQKALRPVGLTLPQFVILTVTAYLQSHGQYVTQTMIATESQIDTMTTSQIVRLLEKKNYIIRTKHPKDSRANVIQLKPSGLDKVTLALPLIEKIDDGFFGILESEELYFKSLLQRLS
ncbi:hypothetical protein SPSIL_036860 [Sporomusa silvacetica DSM 10669]|uniref:HTH marR-type domain-containing protein n=1 Tax=Sporomusa silvacetica DSM 10669 TaxID=1123289 RepID=A0ABZ3IP36_9FIRM|nr:MarR family transcriptional regulator [Sporomusa silvacetica]OZC19869.1 MarR family protein [Sporomusa silvacetica DSM 10669]